jgi:alkanesulfonate monooxygenase SsuD/methylene tetrahydromethanopterin reductase-like flavin-dependent oxidoreductase (luciferase family)
VTTSGSTIVSKAARCFSPTSTMTVSRSSANSPAFGWTSLAMVATASRRVRLGSTASTIVREAW